MGQPIRGDMNIQYYENLLQQFKVNDLQSFLVSFKVQKMGKKNDLLVRCQEILRNAVTQKVAVDRIRELANKMQQPPRPAPYQQPAAANYNAMQPRYPAQVANGGGMNMMQGYGGYGIHAAAMPHMANAGSVVTTQMNRHVRNLTPIALPFYDPITTILEPMELMASASGMKQAQKAIFNFSIPVEHARQLMRPDTRPDDFPRTEVQLRFFNITGEYQGVEQADDFPLNASCRIDDVSVQLPSVIPTNKPNAEPKRPSRPVNVTSSVIATAQREPGRNHRLCVEWTADRRVWAVAIYVVSRVNSAILRERVVKSAVHHRPVATTEEEVRKRLGVDDDDGVQMDSLKITLLCPLGRTRMQIAARARGCTHLQCMDLNNYLQMNEKRPTWKCAVCSGSATFQNLQIDEYFMKLLKDMSHSTTEVELLRDGGFKVVQEEINDISDSDEDGGGGPPPAKRMAMTAGAGDERKAAAAAGGGTSASAGAGTTAATTGGGGQKNAAAHDVITLSDDDEEDQQMTAALRASIPGQGGGTPFRSSVAPTTTTTARQPAGAGASIAPTNGIGIGAGTGPSSSSASASTTRSPPDSDDSIIILDDTPPRNNQNGVGGAGRRPPSNPSSNNSVQAAASLPFRAAPSPAHGAVASGGASSTGFIFSGGANPNTAGQPQQQQQQQQQQPRTLADIIGKDQSPQHQQQQPSSPLHPAYMLPQHLILNHSHPLPQHHQQQHQQQVVSAGLQPTSPFGWMPTSAPTPLMNGYYSTSAQQPQQQQQQQHPGYSMVGAVPGAVPGGGRPQMHTYGNAFFPATAQQPPSGYASYTLQQMHQQQAMHLHRQQQQNQPHQQHQQAAAAQAQAQQTHQIGSDPNAGYRKQ